MSATIINLVQPMTIQEFAKREAHYTEAMLYKLQHEQMVNGLAVFDTLVKSGALERLCRE